MKHEIIEGAVEGALEGALESAADITLGPFGLARRVINWITTEEPVEMPEAEKERLRRISYGCTATSTSNGTTSIGSNMIRNEHIENEMI